MLPNVLYTNEPHDAVDELLGKFFESENPTSDASRSVLLTRNPEHALELRGFFADLDRMNRLTSPLRSATLSSSPTNNPLVAYLPPGMVLGDYELLEVLGEGGMGVVYRARQVSLNRDVAIKMVRTGRLANPSQVARFRNEAETVAVLDHPHVVPIFEVGEAEGHPFYSMKLVEGGNLLQHLAQFQANPEAAARIVKDVADAVDHAHQHGILHRDLKPSNVLLDGAGRPHVADFGLAKWINVDSELTQSGFLVGTPSYMAPEQAAAGPEGGNIVTTATDVYGLGAVLYALITGKPPFVGDSLLNTLEQVRTKEPALPARLQPRVPRDLQTICLKCLEKEPRRRYPSARALADDLERFLSGQPIAARPVRMWERTWKWARRKPAAAVLMAVSALCALSLIASVLIYNSQLKDAVARTLKQHELAEARYRQARDSMRQMLARLDTDRVADTPRLMELRLALLEDAQPFFESAFEQTDNPDPTLRTDLAFLVAATGSTQASLGRTGPARANLERAVALLESLQDELPADLEQSTDRANQLAGVHSHLALLDQTDGHWTNAARHWREALALYEKIADAHPGAAKWLNKQADAEHMLGAFHQTRDQRSEAVAHYQKSVALRNQLVAANPEDDSYHVQLAGTEQNLGLICAQLGQASDAQAAYEKAIRLLQPLTFRHPENTTNQLILAAAYGNQGNLLMGLGRHDEAAKAFDLGIASAESVLEREPHLSVARSRGLELHGGRAQLHNKLGQWAQSLEHWDRVIELNDAPSTWRYRLCRCVSLVRAGDYVHAVTEARSLEADAQLPADGLGDVAQVYTWATDLARKDTALPLAKRKALAEEYAVHAVAIYAKLLERGHFQNAAKAKEFINDPDLRALHDRTDFQKVLEQVKSIRH